MFALFVFVIVCWVLSIHFLCCLVHPIISFFFLFLASDVGPLILKGIYQPHRPSTDDLRLIVYGRESDVLLLEQAPFTSAASKWLSEVSA